MGYIYLDTLLTGTREGADKVHLFSQFYVLPKEGIPETGNQWYLMQDSPFSTFHLILDLHPADIMT